MQSTTEQLLTLQELAEVLKTTERTVYSMVKAEEIPFIRLGENGNYRFNKKEVLEFLRKSNKG